MTIAKYVKEGQDYPRWYGSVCYTEKDNDWVKMCLPIPLNILAIYLLKIRRFLKFKKDRHSIAMYNLGYERGKAGMSR